MKINLEISSAIIANLMISAIESGDPVTTAARGGWCNGIKSLSAKRAGLWYAEPSFWEGKFSVQIIEVDDESTGHETIHKVRPKDVKRGLEVMARVFPHRFSQILQDDTDAPCADAFLQSIVFGEEKYA